LLCLERGKEQGAGSKRIEKNYKKRRKWSGRANLFSAKQSVAFSL
jgi:hypothetical protein